MSTKLINAAGMIIGLYRIKRVRAGRKDADEFKLSVLVDGECRLRSSISIERHGFEPAFLIAITKISDLHKCNLQEKKELYSTMDKYFSL